MARMAYSTKKRSLKRHITTSRSCRVIPKTAKGIAVVFWRPIQRVLLKEKGLKYAAHKPSLVISPSKALWRQVVYSSRWRNWFPEEVAYLTSWAVEHHTKAFVALPHPPDVVRNFCLWIQQNALDAQPSVRSHPEKVSFRKLRDLLLVTLKWLENRLMSFIYVQKALLVYFRGLCSLFSISLATGLRKIYRPPSFIALRMSCKNHFVDLKIIFGIIQCALVQTCFIDFQVVSPSWPSGHFPTSACALKAIERI